MEPVKILLLCSSRLALPALQELAFFNLLAAVVVPRYSDEMIEVTTYMLTGKDIPILVVDKSTYAKEIAGAIETHRVTAGLIITFGYKIPPAVYALPPHGFYNVHPGPLPAYRGADPIFQQIKNREKLAGVTIHQLTEDFDAGPVVIKEMIRMEASDTHGMLTTRLAKVTARLVMVLVKLFTFGVAVPLKAQDESKAAYYRKQAAEDVTINWQSMDAHTIIALINACNPWNKGASTKIRNKIIRLLEADHVTPALATENMPGTILTIDANGIIVSTLHNQGIRVRIVHVDEGFVSAERLVQLGVQVNDRFEMI